ncbi:MAG: Urease accessory protein UreF [Rhodospirillaceae bacterium]|nr:MAG: Urease accessory protein UreF [Rhodospirillaceae bacterium]
MALLGDAFAKVMVGVWGLELPAGMVGDKAYPVLFALAARQFGIDMEAALAAFLHAWLANQVSVACRVIPLGQTDGQRIMAAFESDIAALAASLSQPEADQSQPPLSAALVADWCSVKHETQYSRLFRS